MSERAMIRVRRMARTIDKGLEILSFLLSKEGRRLLTAGSDRGVPSVTAVSQPLIERFGQEAMSPAPVRRFVGLIARAVLGDEGYAPIQAGVRIRQDPLFTAGTVYAKHSAPKSRYAGDVLERLLAGLSPEEMRSALSFLQQRLAHLQDTPGFNNETTNNRTGD